MVPPTGEPPKRPRAAGCPALRPAGYPPPVRRLLVAFDKFRGSASAAELDAAAATAARAAGWSAQVVPMADGGEGLLECVDGELRWTTVAGPLGEPVEAAWRLAASAGEGDGPVAVIEMAQASGLGLLGGAGANDPEAATTRGTGELVLAAAEAGARRIVVGCGGSATTDGGLGAVEVLAGRPELAGVDLVVACDVTTPFLEAARVFAPQKGADPACVERLTRRLGDLAASYRDRFGIDVTTLGGAGAAGGLAGGLAALGGRLVSGFELVAALHDLDGALAAATLVVTGEGRLDATSLEGKVVGGILARAAGHAPVLVVAGAVGAGLDTNGLPGEATVVSLSDRFGESASFDRPTTLVEEVVAAFLTRLGPHGQDLRP